METKKKHVKYEIRELTLCEMLVSLSDLLALCFAYRHDLTFFEQYENYFDHKPGFIRYPFCDDCSGLKAHAYQHQFAFHNSYFTCS